MATSPLLLMPTIGAGATYTVTDTNDGSTSYTDTGSLECALANATNGDTDNLQAGLGTITLSQALPIISYGITINGNGNTISDAHTYRPFFVDAGSLAVHNNNLILSNGFA